MHKLCFLCFFYLFLQKQKWWCSSQLRTWNYLTLCAITWQQLMPQLLFPLKMSLCPIPLCTTQCWVWGKVYSLRIISGPHTIDLIRILQHQYTFIFLFDMFSESLSKRHFCTQKWAPPIKACALHFQGSCQLPDHSRWCCVTPFPCFLLCDRGTSITSSFNKLLSR